MWSWEFKPSSFWVAGCVGLECGIPFQTDRLSSERVGRIVTVTAGSWPLIYGCDVVLSKELLADFLNGACGRMIKLELSDRRYFRLRSPVAQFSD